MKVVKNAQTAAGLHAVRDIMIHVYTGNGKGKTTASIGLCIRFVGSGKKALMIQFLKTNGSSEIKTIEKIENFDIKCFGRKGVLRPEDVNEEDSLLVIDGIIFLEENIEKYDLFVLDEINVAISLGLVPAEQIIAFLKKNRTKEFVLTGRNAPEEIIKMADLVTEFKEIKHYFKKGVSAREGIEY